MAKTSVVYHNMNNSTNSIRHHSSKLTHLLSFKNMDLKMDHHTGGKWLIHSLKHRTKNQLRTPVDYP